MVLVPILSGLVNLKHLRLKGAPSTSILLVLTALPNLRSLDTEFIPPLQSSESEGAMPSLEHLIIRVRVSRTDGLWEWIRRLAPKPSLASVGLSTFSAVGGMKLPREILTFLAEVHGSTLRSIQLDHLQILLPDIQYLCDRIPNLEELTCSVPVIRIVSDF